MLNKMKEYIDLVEIAESIFKSDISWRSKYDLIFSEDISRKLFALFGLNWDDPDMDYEDDVRAFMSAITEKKNEFIKILKNYNCEAGEE